MESNKEVIKITDKIFNKLYENKNLSKNELFIFWDVLRSCYGKRSCIDKHNRLAGKILSELSHEN